MASPKALTNNHHQDGWLIVAIVMTVIETLFFGLRVLCRRMTAVSWGFDDYLVALAYASCIALNGVGIAITTRTWVGQQTAEVVELDNPSVILFLKLQMPLAIFYLFAAIIPKASIVALFLRIFIQRPFRIACWTLQAIFLLYLLVGLVSIFVACQPFSANFQLPTDLAAGEHCIDISAQYKAVSYANLVTDVAIIILPTPVVWKIKKSVRDRIGLLCICCLGIVGLGFSIARLAAVVGVFDENDVLWTAAFTGVFTTLEPGSYLLVACMMTFRQLSHLKWSNVKRLTSGESEGTEMSHRFQKVESFKAAPDGLSTTQGSKQSDARTAP